MFYFSLSTAQTTFFLLIDGTNSCKMLHIKPVLFFFPVEFGIIVTTAGKPFVDIMVSCSSYEPDLKAAVVIAPEPAAYDCETLAAESAALQGFERVTVEPAVAAVAAADPPLLEAASLEPMLATTL